MPTESNFRVSVEILRQFCQDILESSDVSKEFASLIADSLVEADARGLFSHGTLRLLPVYLRRIRAGTTRANPQIRIVRQFGSVALLDGDAGPGQVVGNYAIQLGISLAKEHGVGVVGVQNSSHFGACTFFARQAVQANMISMVMTNAPSNMPPWGGRAPYFGTNPLCVALPCGEEEPVILDMSTSVVARGKIVIAAQNGETIPSGWAVDHQGLPTQDANAALNGAVLPFGGYKGAGLALIIDALCGVLTGSAFGCHIVNLYDEGSDVQNVGHFFLVLNVEVLAPFDEFQQRMDQFVREIRSQPRMPGVDRLYVPGEIEQEQEQISRSEGIALPDISVLDDLAKELGVITLSDRL